MPLADPIPSPELLEEFSRFFRLLSEPTRLRLLWLIRQGPKDVMWTQRREKLWHESDAPPHSRRWQPREAPLIVMVSAYHTKMIRSLAELSA